MASALYWNDTRDGTRNGTRDGTRNGTRGSFFICFIYACLRIVMSNTISISDDRRQC